MKIPNKIIHTPETSFYDSLEDFANKINQLIDTITEQQAQITNLRGGWTDVEIKKAVIKPAHKIPEILQMIREANPELREECANCDGHGKEICTNPDHGFINAVGGDIGRIGCPACGHDEYCRTTEDCFKCDGTGESVGLTPHLEHLLVALGSAKPSDLYSIDNAGFLWKKDGLNKILITSTFDKYNLRKSLEFNLETNIFLRNTLYNLLITK